MTEKELPAENKLEIVQQAEDFVAKIDRQAFKAMFYLFAGKPDSKQRAYEGKVILAPDDITDLAERIASKFETHNIDTELCSVSVSLAKKKTIEFSSMADFKSQDWKLPEKIEDVTVRWDFMIRIGSHVLPQKHMLTVRIAKNSPGSDGMRIMVNEMTQEVSVMGIGDQCVAKIDFISHILADELLALVGVWHSTLRKPKNDSGFLTKLEPIDGIIANAVRLSILVAFGLVLFAVLAHILPAAAGTSAITTNTARDLAMFAVAATVGFNLISAVGRFLGGRMYNTINSYGAHHPFLFTRGDEEARDRIDATDAGAIKKFFVYVALPLLINLIAGIVLWKVLP